MGFFGSIGDNPSLGVQFKPFGRWEETIYTTKRLKANIKAASLSAQMSVCREIARRVKAHLRDQDLPWRELSRRYVKQKEKYGRDPRILISHGIYYHAIEVFQKGNQKLAFVGVRRGIYGKTVKGKRGRLQVADYAAIAEFSYNPKFRRPVWNPTIRDMGNSPGLKALYSKFFYNALKRRGVPIAKINSLMPKW